MLGHDAVLCQRDLLHNIMYSTVYVFNITFGVTMPRDLYMCLRNLQNLKQLLIQAP